MRHHVYSRVQHVSLLQGSPQCPVQAVLEIELALPVDDMGKEVAIERGVLVEQGREIEGVLGRDELVEPYLMRRKLSPVCDRQAMLGVGPRVVHSFEDHSLSLGHAATSSNRMLTAPLTVPTVLVRYS